MFVFDVPELFLSKSFGLFVSHACECFEAIKHEADDFVLVILLGYVITHSAERLVQDGHEHVDDDKRHGDNKEEDDDLKHDVMTHLTNTAHVDSYFLNCNMMLITQMPMMTFVMYSP